MALHELNSPDSLWEEVMSCHFHPRSDDHKTASQLNWPTANVFVHFNMGNPKVRGQNNERKQEERTTRMGSKEWEQLWVIRSRQSLNGHQRGAREPKVPGDTGKPLVLGTHWMSLSYPHQLPPTVSSESQTIPSTHYQDQHHLALMPFPSIWSNPRGRPLNIKHS